MTTTEPVGTRPAGRGARRSASLMARVVIGGLSLSITALLYAGMEMDNRAAATDRPEVQQSASSGQVSVIIRRHSASEGSQGRVSPATGAAKGSSTGVKPRAKSRAS